jgi:hypothetical protein
MRNPAKRAPWTLVAALLLTSFIPAEGATVRRYQLDEVRDQAVSIFWGQVVDRSTRIGTNGKMVWTDYEISVSEHLKGNDPGIRTTVSFAGGTKGDLSIGISGMPRLEVGGTYVFFQNKPAPDGQPYINATIGWGQGLYRIERVTIDGMTRDLLVSFDGEPLERSEDGRIMRGPRIAVANGSIHEPRLRIDDSTPRMTDPIVTSADGAPVRQNRSVPNVSPARQRNFATLDDLRAFVDGRMEAVTSSPRNR